MRFRVEQCFPAAPRRVLAAYVDPGFYRHLHHLPTVHPPEVLHRSVDDHRARLRIRYRFSGELSPTVSRVVDPSRLVWVEDSVYDLDGCTSTFRISPEHYGERLRCAGGTVLVDLDGGTCRVVEGDLEVRYRFVGRMVERAVVSGLRDHLLREAALLTDWLARAGSG